MTQTVDDALRAATLYSDGLLYVFVKLPARAITAAAGIIAEYGAPFCGLIVDKDEVTLMIPQDAFDDFSERLPGHVLADGRYRLITLDVALDANLIGFMARISAALAAAGVPIFPYAAYTRDHLFVPVEKFDLAMNALKTLGAAV